MCIFGAKHSVHLRQKATLGDCKIELRERREAWSADSETIIIAALFWSHAPANAAATASWNSQLNVTFAHLYLFHVSSSRVTRSTTNLIFMVDS